MAQQAQGRFGYKTVQLIKPEPLGTGSYGAVYKAMCDDLTCAGKILHATLFQSSDPGAMTVMKRFQQECSFLSAIRHPNIVQFLGSHQDPETQRPVLLMELMDKSLTRFLEQSQEPLPYFTQVNICHDIALALAYLHLNDIIHRDLSSNNVLLIGAGNRAKVADFGMAKLFDENRSTMSPQTTCPGTQPYMSPEALDEPPVYTKMLDCFSFGVLGIQIITRQFPDPGPRTKKISDPLSPTGSKYVPVLETERRKSHIGLIGPTHPLLPITINCLSYNEKDRPSAQKLCHRLAALKQASQYGDSVQKAKERSRPATHLIDKLQQDLEQKEEVHKENQLLQRKLQMKEQEIEARERQLRKLNQHLTDNEQVTAQFQQDLLQREKMMQKLQEEKQHLQQELQRKKQKEEELQREKEELQLQQQEVERIREENKCLQQNLRIEKQRNQKKKQEIRRVSQEKDCTERQLQELNLQLADSEQVTTEFQQNLQQREEKIHKLQEDNKQLQQKLQGKDKVLKQKLTLSWKTCKRAPCKMSRGSATVCGNIAYFRPDDSSQVHSYNSDTEEWSRVPEVSST